MCFRVFFPFGGDFFGLLRLEFFVFVFLCGILVVWMGFLLLFVFLFFFKLYFYFVLLTPSSEVTKTV